MTHRFPSRAAFNALKEGQSQLDADGCMVGVSRQALDEVLEFVGHHLPVNLADDQLAETEVGESWEIGLIMAEQQASQIQLIRLNDRVFVPEVITVIEETRGGTPILIDGDFAIHTHADFVELIAHAEEGDDPAPIISAAWDYAKRMKAMGPHIPEDFMLTVYHPLGGQIWTMPLTQCPECTARMDDGK